MPLLDIALGFVTLTVGVGSALLAAVYWSAGGLTLLSFGLFALLFGTQILLTAPALAPLLSVSPQALAYISPMLNYWLPVPGLIFLEQMLGSGWWSQFRRLWQGWIVVAAGLTGYDLVAGPGAAADPVAQALIVVLMAIVLARVVGWGIPKTRDRLIQTFGFTALVSVVLHDNLVGFDLLPWDFTFDTTYGLGIFILSLGYTTARQFFSTQRELATMEYELRTASTIQSSILPSGTPSVPGLDIAVRYVPMRTVAGDIYDFVVNGPQVSVLVADVTGHGVPAALIASMAKVAFSAQAEAAPYPGQVLAGMNKALCGQLEGQFVTATYVHIDTSTHRVRYSNAGHPPPLLWQPGPGQIVELAGGGVFMGFDPGATYPASEIPVGRGDRLVLYTDGLLEVTNSAGQYFGDDELKAFIEANNERRVDDFADALLAHLQHWSGHGRDERPFEDDLTLAVVDIRA